jgi:hypothetical protein
MGECDQFDVKWFVANWGLWNIGKDVLLITSVDVNIEDINEFFGPKMNKNGWKYDNQHDEEVAKKIAKIYCKVTKKHKVMNKQLSITFNWAGFGVHTMKQRLLLKKTKQ